MRTTAAIMSVLALAGCATATDMREKGPDVTFLSEKTPEAFRDCLFGRAPNALSVSPYGSGWVVARNDIGPYVNFTEIMPEEGRARVSVFGARGVRMSAEACR